VGNNHHASDFAEQFSEGWGAAGIHFGGYGFVLKVQSAQMNAFMNMFK
jgi:hypothetical protein